MFIEKLAWVAVAAIQLIGTANAQSLEAVVMFPRGTAIESGQVGVLLGRTPGVVRDINDCDNSTGDHRTFNVILVVPHEGGGSHESNLIVIDATAEFDTGARLTQFEAIGLCIGPEGLEYDRYRVQVQRAATQPTSFHVDFISPPDARVTSGTGSDLGVVLGRPLGTVDEAVLGDCGDSGSFPLHNIVFTRPGAGVGSDVVAVIVTAADERLPPGTRFEGIHGLGFCTIADGSVYSKYRAKP